MTIEQKKTDDTTKSEEEKKVDEGAAEDVDTDEVDTSEDEADSQDKDNQPDYKAIAETEKQKRLDAEKSYKARDRKRKGQEEEFEVDTEDEEDENKPVTGKQLKSILAENTKQTERRLLGGQIKRIATDLSSSDDEAQAIIATHANRNWPSDISLEQQLEEAQAIVNRKVIVSKNSELKRALKSKETSSKDNANPHHNPMEGAGPKIDSKLKASLLAQKFELQPNTKSIWRKKLPNGTYLYKDVSKTPIKTWGGK